MFNTAKLDQLEQQHKDLRHEVADIRAIVVRIETRLCKLMEHEGALGLIYKPEENRK